ncbi:MAG: LD-carboxypeptidase [Peptococcaceae bacterium]|nr:LD-carboxypeptidase [Peptococcaceae bacterium]
MPLIGEGGVGLIRKPAALKDGSTLGIIAPASPCGNPDSIARGKIILEEMGFRVVLAPNALKSDRYLAGTDSERVADLHRMFLDPRIDGILCLRGGYGTLRLLRQINYRIIKSRPKVLVGYSDITALQLAIWQKAGLVTFSGPMLASDFGLEPGDFTVNHFYQALTSYHPLGPVPAAPGAMTHTIYPGRARGRLIGGNLSLVAATLGTPYEIDTRGAILFLEEVGEEPYRVDRMLRQLYLAGKLHKAAGVVFGEFVDCEAGDKSASFTCGEITADLFNRLKIPCFYGLGPGHGASKVTMPLGVKAQIDAGRCQLVIIEPAVVAPFK